MCPRRLANEVDKNNAAQEDREIVVSANHPSRSSKLFAGKFFISKCVRFPPAAAVRPSAQVYGFLSDRQCNPQADGSATAYARKPQISERGIEPRSRE